MKKIEYFARFVLKHRTSRRFSKNLLKLTKTQQKN